MLGLSYRMRTCWSRTLEGPDRSPISAERCGVLDPETGGDVISFWPVGALGGSLDQGDAIHFLAGLCCGRPLLRPAGHRPNARHRASSARTLGRSCCGAEILPSRYGIRPYLHLSELFIQEARPATQGFAMLGERGS